jgi:hypothetical protein
MNALIRLVLVATVAGAAFRLVPPAEVPPVREVNPFTQSGARGFARIVWFSDDKSNPIAG